MQAIKILLTNNKMAAAWLSLFLLLSGCERSDYENAVPGRDNQVSGEPVTFSISMSNIPQYNDPGSAGAASRSGEPIISEWVKVNSFSMTRSAGKDYQEPKLALLEMVEDSVPVAGTRGVMPSNYRFRLIAFKQSGNGNYVYHSAGEYTSNGSSAPTLVRGGIKVLSRRQTYRFVGYSFYNTTDMGSLPSTYSWNSTTITIPNMSNDFLAFDSGDVVISGDTYELSVNFKHQLTKLTVKPDALGLGDETVKNCTGVYIKQCGNSSAWKVGGTIVKNSNSSATFNIPNNGSATVRVVPQGVSQKVSVYIGAITAGGYALSSLNFTSSKSVNMLSGKSYTMTIRISSPGITVAASEINLGGGMCSDTYKQRLSKLTWAGGNLKTIMPDKVPFTPLYEWTTPTDYGYYYTWCSPYIEDTFYDGKDPCSRLNDFKYGVGWRTPSEDDLHALYCCTDGKIATNNNVRGMWFMNVDNGLFLPLAGYRGAESGGGTVATGSADVNGRYWSSEEYFNDKNGYYLSFDIDGVRIANALKTYGFSVRCVKEINRE